MLVVKNNEQRSSTAASRLMPAGQSKQLAAENGVAVEAAVCLSLRLSCYSLLVSTVNNAAVRQLSGQVRTLTEGLSSQQERLSWISRDVTNIKTFQIQLAHQMRALANVVNTHGLAIQACQSDVASLTKRLARWDWVVDGCCGLSAYITSGLVIKLFQYVSSTAARARQSSHYLVAHSKTRAGVWIAAMAAVRMFLAWKLFLKFQQLCIQFGLRTSLLKAPPVSLAGAREFMSLVPYREALVGSVP